MQTQNGACPKSLLNRLLESAGAVDGFNCMPSHCPEGLDMFIDHVLPELRRRQLIQTSYQCKFLRDNLERGL